LVTLTICYSWSNITPCYLHSVRSKYFLSNSVSPSNHVLP
jgi:hypothetical protein